MDGKCPKCAAVVDPALGLACDWCGRSMHYSCLAMPPDAITSCDRLVGCHPMQSYFVRTVQTILIHLKLIQVLSQTCLLNSLERLLKKNVEVILRK